MFGKTAKTSLPPWEVGHPDHNRTNADMKDVKLHILMLLMVCSLDLNCSMDTVECKCMDQGWLHKKAFYIS